MTTLDIDPLAFNVDDLFLLHRQTLILTLARIVGCPQTAEDLAQDSYLKLLRASETQKITHPEPFLFQIGRNLAIDHIRKQRVRNQAIDEPVPTEAYSVDFLDRLPSNTPSPEQIAVNEQQVALMLDALKGLSERRRQILVLHKFHHWPYERIAKHFDISRSAVEKNVQVAITHLIAAQDDGPPFF